MPRLEAFSLDVHCISELLRLKLHSSYPFSMMLCLLAFHSCYLPRRHCI